MRLFGRIWLVLVVGKGRRGDGSDAESFYSVIGIQDRFTDFFLSDFESIRDEFCLASLHGLCLLAGNGEGGLLRLVL